jgi:hypothetical protein
MSKNDSEETLLVPPSQLRRNQRYCSKVRVDRCASVRSVDSVCFCLWPIAALDGACPHP